MGWIKPLVLASVLFRAIPSMAQESMDLPLIKLLRSFTTTPNGGKKYFDGPLTSERYAYKV